MSLLNKSGLRVQPFKHGPDFIDPGYHQLATGNTSYNLDFWMMSKTHMQHVFNTKMANADVGIIEGMGALFDGEDGTENGSGSYLSELLKVPVLLVVDVEGMTNSANALLRGFLNFKPQVDFCGIIFNKVGGAKHYQMIYQNLDERFQRLSLGYLQQNRKLKIPERHLGLLTVEENHSAHDMEHILNEAGKTLNLKRLRLTTSTGLRQKQTQKLPVKNKTRIGIAKDKAFCFYYKKNLDVLEDNGAELVPFSPLNDKALPKDLDGLYFGGGYPELFAESLAKNTSLKEQILNSSQSNMPIYAECGGFIYLCRQLAVEAQSFEMVGCFSPKVIWDKSYLAIRYLKVATKRDTIFGPSGTIIRGQEFHQTRLSSALHDHECTFTVESSSGERFNAGICVNHTLGSYAHLYFPSSPSIVTNLIKECLKFNRQNLSAYA